MVLNTPYPLEDLESVVFFQEGPGLLSSQFCQDADDGVPFINIRVIGDDGAIDKSKCSYVKREEFEKKYKHFLLDDGDFVVSSSGTLGKLAEIKKSDLPLMLNTSVIRFRSVDEQVLDKGFLKWFIKSDLYIFQIQKASTGTAIKNYGPSHLKKMKIPLPPLETQKQIAAILEKADQLRKDCQQMEHELNNLAKSVFMDMFGDPLSNPKGWERRVLSEFYCDEKTGTKCGPFGSALKKEDFSDSGVPVWNMDNITLSGSFIDEPSLFVPKEKYAPLQSYSVMPGDVIISRAGTVGKMGVVYSKHPESLISTNLIRVRFGEQMLPEYFVSLMLYCKTRLKRLKVGADGDFSHMNTGILDQLEFPYPPIEIQRQYVEYLGKINRELISRKDLSAELDEQFQSLSTKAFSGELKIKNKAA